MAPQFPCHDPRTTAKGGEVRKQCHLDFDLCHRCSIKYILDGKGIYPAEHRCGSGGHSINSQHQRSVALDDLINLPCF